MLRIRIIFIFSIVGCCFIDTFSQRRVDQISDTIQMDTAVSCGKLPNGFVYYVRRNEHPRGRVMMCLTVKAGAANEGTGQLEAAHVLEHMAFKGTKHFPDPWRFLGQIGIQRGRDVNASTRDCYTSYWIDIPSNNLDTLRRCLLLFRDFAGDLILKDESLDSERGVVTAELNRSSGYQQRILAQYVGELRVQSGLMSTIANKKERIKSLQSLDRNSLLSFYKKWYVPALQSIAIVGDVDENVMANEIVNHFGDLVKGEPIKSPSPIEPIRLTSRNRFVFVSDNEIPSIEIRIDIRRRSSPLFKALDYREVFVEELFNEMIDARLAETNNQYNMPFQLLQISAGGGGFEYFKAVRAYLIIKRKYLREGFITAVEELNRVARHGFTKEELNAAIKTILNKTARCEQITSKELASGYQQHFLEGTVVPNGLQLSDLKLRILTDLRIKDVNALVKSWIADKGWDIAVFSPSSDIIPEKAMFETWLAEARQRDVKPYKAVASTKDLQWREDFHHNPFITDSSYFKESAVTRLTLDNGVSVILKPFSVDGTKDGAIEVNVFGYGGAGQFDDRDYYMASYSGEIIENSGTGGLNKFELNRFLSSKGITVQPYTYHYYQGVRASGKTSEFALMMKLLYLYFYSPNKNEDAFQDWKSRQEDILRQERPTSFQLFEDSVQEITHDFGILRGRLDWRRLQEFDFQRVYSLYRAMFSNASNLTIVIAGQFDKDDVVGDIVKYLGNFKTSLNLPEPNMEVIPIGMRKRFEGTEEMDKSLVRIYFSMVGDFTDRDIFGFDLLSNVLQIRLINRLREDEGGTYDVLCQGSFRRMPFVGYKMKIEFECPASAVDRMISAVEDEIETMKLSGPGSDLIREAVVNGKQLLDNIDDFSFWRNYLTLQSQQGRGIDALFMKNQVQQNFTNEDLKKLSIMYLKRSNCMIFILAPSPK